MPLWPADLPVHTLRTPQGDSATVSLHGAQVLSWLTTDGTERLYLSPQIDWQAVQQGHSGIRGGIPICWPQFNRRGNLPKHGFARLLPWRVAQAEDDQITLQLCDSDVPAHFLHDAQGKAVWPHGFATTLHIALAANTLTLTLSVRNTGNTALPFTTAFHGYFSTANIAESHIHGANGLQYWDAVAGANPTHPVQSGAITFANEVDRVYPAFDANLICADQSLRLTQSSSLQQTVVWNPGAKLCAQLADLPPEAYRHFVCIEAAQIDDAVVLQPNAEWQGSQTFIACKCG